MSVSRWRRLPTGSLPGCCAISCLSLSRISGKSACSALSSVSKGNAFTSPPCAARAFASVLAKLPFELCDPPNPETGSPPPTSPPEQPDQLLAKQDDDSSSTATGWSSVEGEITRLLPEIPREEATPDFLIREDSDTPSKTYRLLRAALVASAAVVTIVLVSPYLVWFAVVSGHDSLPLRAKHFHGGKFR